MRRIAILVAVMLSACTSGGFDRGWSEETTGALDPDPPPALCDLCVNTPPATYTGPSNFWMGPLGGAADCPAATPLQGFEGYLLHPSRIRQFARECLVTPSDTCAIEGQVCAPAPDADYHTCIHHSGEAPCRDAAYPEQYLVTEAESHLLVTLCCQPTPISG